MRSLLAEGVLRLASSLIVPSGCSHVDGEHAFDEPALMVDGSRVQPLVACLLCCPARGT